MNEIKEPHQIARIIFKAIIFKPTNKNSKFRASCHTLKYLETDLNARIIERQVTIQ